MKQQDANNEIKNRSASAEQLPARYSENLADMPTIKLPDKPKLKSAAKQFNASQNRPAAQQQSSPQPKTPAKKPAAQQTTAATTQKKQRPAKAQPVQQESPLDRLSEKLHRRRQKEPEQQQQPAVSKRSAVQKQQPVSKQTSVPAQQPAPKHLQPKETLTASEERLDQAPKKKKKWVIVIPVVAACLLFLAFFGVLALHFVASSNLAAVPNVHPHEITDFSITLAWDPVKHATGYHVFQREENSDNYLQIASTGDLYYIVYDLEQATDYSFYVKAYNGSSESEEYTPLENISTLLRQEHITNISSTEAQTVHVEWDTNDVADGYLLEFHTIGKNFSDENKITIHEGEPNVYNITDLKPLAHIGVRVTAFVNRDGKQVWGTPSNEKAIRVSDGTGNGYEILQTDHPMVALTFDDGPGGKPSDRILDTLEQYNARATFFMVGENVLNFPDNVRRKAQLGMELGNHTWNHERYGDDVTNDDILQASEAIEEVTGQWPSAFRSPGGITTEDILDESANEHLPAYRWSVDTEDWKNRDTDTIIQNVLDNVQDGDIILMHEIYDFTADAVETIVPELIDRGFELVTCRELVQAKTGGDPEFFTEYFDFK